MAQLEGAAGGEAVNSDSTPAHDPIDAIVNEMLPDDDEQDEPAAGANEDGLTADDATDEDEQALPAIKPPVSWTAEEQEHFKSLPPEVQETLSRRESEREKFVQSKAGEAAQARQHAAQEAMAEVARLSQNYAEQFRHALPYIPERPSYQLQVDDPIAFAEQMDAHERAVAQHQHVQQQIGNARNQAAQAEQILWQHEQQETYARVSQAFPEFYDPTTGPKLREQLGSTALALGYPAERLREADAEDILAIRTATDWKAKADKYDALMAQKMEKVREARGLPRVSRPGTAPTRAQVGQKAVEGAWSRVKETKGRARDDAFADYLGKTGVI